MASPTSIFDEMRNAGRGVLGLLTGDRQVARWFDFSDRGLVGSFIAFLAVTAFNAVLPKLLGMPTGPILRGVVAAAILVACQIGFTAIALRQLKRLDGLVPYLVADNWATFFITIGTTLLALAGLSGDAAVIAIGVLAIIVEINIARLILKLAPMQIALLLVAQLVGVSIGLLLAAFILPPSPAAQAALQTLAG